MSLVVTLSGRGKECGFPYKTHEHMEVLIKEKAEIEAIKLQDPFKERRARAYEADAGFLDCLHPRPAQMETGKCKDRVRVKRKRGEQSQGEMLGKQSMPENFAAPQIWDDSVIGEAEEPKRGSHLENNWQ
jgi:hypothetical protein